VVGIALICNCLDMVSKFAAAYLTGSKSLFAEGVHSTMDTFNQVVLYMGIRYSQRIADPHFPYGYSNMRYVSSLISGCGIAAFGCGLSIYHGVSGLLAGQTEMEPLTYAFVALGLSLCFQSFSLYNAFKEIRAKAQHSGVTFLDYSKTAQLTSDTHGTPLQFQCAPVATPASTW
jgi:zinc transporter 9